MAIEYDVTTQQFVSYTPVTILDNLAQKTVMIFYALNNLPGVDSGALFVDKGQSASVGWGTGIENSAANPHKFEFAQFWSTQNGNWKTDDNTSTTNVRDFTVTYDRGSTGNDPLFYIDGVSVNVNESSAPTGTVNSDSGEDLLVGCLDSAVTYPSMDGKIYGLFIWNRIVSAVDIASMSSARSVRGHGYGLVFSEKFIGASGLQVYDGTVLSGSNLFVDDISGIQGTPTGSPVGRSGTYMSYGR